MIMLLARFFEEIRAAGPGGLEPALRTAVRGTMRGTAVASLATSIAYGSLVFAGFRGFREFGIIGGIGMVLCWIVTFATGPALIAVVHRIKPLGARNEGSHVVAGAVGRFVVGHPRAILATALVMSCAAIVVTIPFAFDPFEYDFRNLRNKEGTTRGSAKISYRIDRIFDLPQSPTPVVADNLADVPRIQQAILDAPGARAVIGDAKTLFDFLPKDQEAKLDVLAEIRALIDRKIDFLSEEDQKEILDYRPPERLRVLALDDVPEMVARPFAESDGTRGRVLFVYAHKDESLLEGRYLLKFAQFIRGIHVEGAHFVAVGQPMVFADMIAAIIHDGIKVSIIAVTGILVLLVVAFRSRRAVFGVAMAVGFGTLWMIACAALFDLKLNFLNFVVLPIILGDGVDYGANLWERYREDGPGNNADIIKSTGGAVVLESITANIGYATLILSTNMALQSFGILANIGEYTTLAAAVIVMMAFLTWRERSRRARVAVPAPAGAGAGESPQA
jgi:predicted RND superfamily exporter protein